MNIMLVSVTERTREIGIRIAVGARYRDILGQFLLEAILICLVGGLIGTLLGVGLSWLVSSKADMQVVVSSQSILLAFGFSSVIGIFFGFYPARKAAAMNPVEALRHE
jgi:putative ABC transport system permease protein